MSARKNTSRLKITAPSVAMKKMGLQFFQDEGSLLSALLGLADEAPEDVPDIPDSFVALHAQGLVSQRFITWSVGPVRMGDTDITVIGAVWSPALRTGLFIGCCEGTMLEAMKGFTYGGSLQFTRENLKPFLADLLDVDQGLFGAASGVVRVINFAPELVPGDLVEEYYLGFHEKHNAQEPFVLIYKEFLKGQALPSTMALTSDDMELNKV